MQNMLVGRSHAIRQVREAITRVAPSNASVIITGPSGSGKELVASAIHSSSNRRTNPLVALNCGAIPADLLESELFGHEKGAFTGAIQRRVGRFEEASGGTMFLDEIGDMPMAMQVKLLRVLEERKVQRVGATGDLAIDVRLVCATHKDLDLAIESSLFREDLFYRIAVFPIIMPSLAERPEDLTLLVDHFQAGFGGQPFSLSASAVSYIQSYNWPGNVRELRNFVERAMLLFGGKAIDAADAADLINLTPRRRSALSHTPSPVPNAALAHVAPSRAGEDPRMDSSLPALDRAGKLDMNRIIEDIERQYILDALELADGVIAEASRLLGIQRTTLIGKMNKYNMAR